MAIGRARKEMRRMAPKEYAELDELIKVARKLEESGDVFYAFKAYLEAARYCIKSKLDVYTQGECIDKAIELLTKFYEQTLKGLKETKTLTKQERGKFENILRMLGEL